MRRFPIAIVLVAVLAGSVASAAQPRSPAPAQEPTGVLITAVGDTILGSTPDLPPKPRRYLSPVMDALAGQITFANLEGTLTTASHSKCGSGSSNCFAFRNPPAFGEVFHDVGFDVMNSANNHSYDFGSAGFRETARSLHDHGIAQTGRIGQITVIPPSRSGSALSVAFVGFAPYDTVANLLDIPAARRLIRKATTKASVVVVYMHAGAEGSDKQHVTGREEYAFGEDRGNPERFAHMAVDNGADLVIASGPHVLRGMELYRHRLIAYSLGNFSSYHNFNTDGVVSLSGILRAWVGPKGWFQRGWFLSAKLNGEGRASRDYSHRAAQLVTKLSRQDFPKRGVRIGRKGAILPRS